MYFNICIIVLVELFQTAALPFEYCLFASSAGHLGWFRPVLFNVISIRICQLCSNASVSLLHDALKRYSTQRLVWCQSSPLTGLERCLSAVSRTKGAGGQRKQRCDKLKGFWSSAVKS